MLVESILLLYKHVSQPLHTNVLEMSIQSVVKISWTCLNRELGNSIVCFVILLNFNKTLFL